eukprot:TRINITY_DN8228_c0_g1_i1.p1 TRINITY_DN8228_c0_g1~~TRINITY_DN8228_c0_g1_i1.p1  ORF type:complete len:641 (-),score=238.70 TRINITY_DN8228_c0_g1_i1:95-2017(-)
MPGKPPASPTPSKKSAPSTPFTPERAGKSPANLFQELSNSAFLRSRILSSVSSLSDWVESDPDLEKRFYAAVKASDAPRVVELLEYDLLNIDWANADDCNRTALHVATEAGNAIIVAMLLGKGADVCLRDAQGKTPMNIALESGDREILLLLANKSLAALERLKAREKLGFGSASAQEIEHVMTRHRLEHYTRLCKHVEAPELNVEEVNELMEKIFKIEEPRTPFQMFFARKSPITSMLTISHVQTIYNVFVAMLMLSLTNTLMHNYYETGQAIDFTILAWVFEGFPVAIVLWLGLFVTSFHAYFLQRAVVANLVSSTVARWVSFVIGIVMHVVSAKSVSFFHFHVATAMALMCEVTRFTMKMHSYLTVNRQLQQAKAAGSDDPDANVFPRNVTLSNYFEFLWFPCLVYQTSYPRNKSINWRFVFRQSLDFAMCILYIYAVFVRYIQPYLHEMKGDYKTLLLGIFKVMLPGMALAMLSFMMLLHSWMNVFAEITRFADRRFYSDWWNARSWSAYYRKWNIVVHNFIHRHIFVELMVNWKVGKHTSMWITFIFSAVIHEYIICVAMGFYKPILFFLFVIPGVLFIYLTRFLKNWSFWNVFMWAMLIIGHGILVGLYSRAWHFHYDDQGPKDNSWLSLLYVL